MSRDTTSIVRGPRWIRIIPPSDPDSLGGTSITGLTSRGGPMELERTSIANLKGLPSAEHDGFGAVNLFRSTTSVSKAPCSSKY